MPKRPELPGYVWDERMRRGMGAWVNTATRRVVSDREVQGLVLQLSNASGKRAAAIAEAAVNGEITPNEFVRAMRSELRNLYNANTALARGGWNRVTDVENGRNGGILRNEYNHLRSFAQDIADGNLTPEQAAARARLYSGKAYSRYWDEDARLRKQDNAYTQERWIDTGDNSECDDCRALAARGWVPIGALGTVPGAGDTACLGNCRCEIEYR